MQEVGGSIPPGSTSLRLLRKLRLGKPVPDARSEASKGCRVVARRAKTDVANEIGRRLQSGAKGEADAMKYVYILESLDSEHFYVGITDDLRARLAKHNAGEVAHTSKYRPWRIKTYIAFSDDKQAVAFERYLKSGSGRAFANKRL
jgi:putative endonuclease